MRCNYSSMASLQWQLKINSISLLPYKILEHNICKHVIKINSQTHHNTAYTIGNIPWTHHCTIKLIVSFKWIIYIIKENNQLVIRHHCMARELETQWVHCPVCRTSLIATRFWVVVICPIIKCLTVLQFSFILFDLCLFITIFNIILNYVPIVTFWIFTYHKIWILLIIFCFIWSYWIIYFLTCLEVFWSVVS